MYRVIALGYRAGMIIDCLRAKKQYDDIRFVYCNIDSDVLMDCGNEGDEHIHLTDIVQCREAIHEDNELMSVLVSCLGNDFNYNCSWKYAAEIMAELWDSSDHSYCFASLPFWAGGQRDMGIEVFNKITDWSDITVLQDDLKEPYRYISLMDNGLVRLLDIVLSHPRRGHGRNKLPFGVRASEKRILTALQAYYSNNMPKYYSEGTFSFHINKHKY